MDQLPQEIINLIASSIEFSSDVSDDPIWSSLPQYASISPSWKLAIERINPHEIYLKSTVLDAFAAICRGDRRWSMRRLTLDVVLPTYDDISCGRLERMAEMNANDEAFTQAMQKLFPDVEVLGRCLTGRQHLSQH